MKSIFIMLFAALLCGNAAFAEKKANVPANVKAAFSKKYSGATKVKWEDEEGKYEVCFTYNSKEMSVLYNAGGTAEEVETKIPINDLPANARKNAMSKGTIKDAAKIEMANGSIQYEAEMKGKDLMFDDKGNFLKEKVEDEKEEKDKD